MRRFASRASFFCLVAAFNFCLSIASPATASEFTVEKNDRGVTVKLDGKLFTEYLLKSGKKPILWPIIGPTGKPMTRAWPMDEAGAVTKDHAHHRSFWFSHGDVNGSDLWTETKGSGSTEHREFVEVAGGKTAKIVTKNDWIDKNGKKAAEDKRTLTFSTDGDSRIIDFDIVVTATEGELKLGDTKEGTFALRVLDDFRLPKQKGKGRIINSEGVANDATWGKRASWVDYEGPIDGETLGIAILNHPSSYGYPTHWHVRDYGLFAANPFGVYDFNGGKGKKGDLTLKPGEKLALRYRVILHRGDEKSAKISESFKAYSEPEQPKLSPTTGRVLIDGQPLTYGYIVFASNNGRPSGARLNRDGTFALSCFGKEDGALVDVHRVSVRAAEQIGLAKIQWHAPKKYASFETSGITAKVIEGKNEFEFNLTWDGGKPFIEVSVENSETTEKK